MSQPPKPATIDFETRSACDIKDSGSWRYSLDSTTEALCMAYRLPHWDEGRTGLWHPAFPQCDISERIDDDLFELWDWIEQGKLVEAHNALFEVGIWSNIMAPRWGWPEVPLRSWRCSAAKAAAHALPRALDDVGHVLGLAVTKGVDIAREVKKMWSPRKPLKDERMAWGRKHAPCATCNATGKVKGINPATGRAKNQPCGRCSGNGYFVWVDIPDMPVLWHESNELFEMLFAYVREDVLAEEAVSNAIPDLSPDETEVFLLDLTVNMRGFPLDTEAIETALTLIDGEFKDLNAELYELTEHRVERATQRARMVAWFAENGLELDNTQADTLDETLGRNDLRPHVRRGLELMRLLGRSSTAKYEAMRDWVCPDARVHGGLLYHGASTGRWTGKGVQPHNFPKLSLVDREDLDEKGEPRAMDPELIWAILKSLDPDLIRAEFPSVMGALSGALRGAIAAPPGEELFVADFAGIEARVLLWAADDEKGLDIFRSGADIYCDMAASIYGYPVTKKNKDERQLGKVAILGLGYQMGAAKFVETAATYGITILEDIWCLHCGEGFKKHTRRDAKCTTFDPDGDLHAMTAVKVVDAYREKFWRVKQLWQDQEAAAIKAVNTGGPVRAGKFVWTMSQDERFLYCRLPSGRKLAYPFPEIHEKRLPWLKNGRPATAPSLTYMGVDSYTRQWKRQTAYGGLIVENEVQAISRDLMAAAMQRMEDSGIYLPVLSVHDEGIALATVGTGDVHAFEQLMAALPPWGAGCPVAAEGWKGSRYRK